MLRLYEDACCRPYSEWRKSRMFDVNVVHIWESLKKQYCLDKKRDVHVLPQLKQA